MVSLLTGPLRRLCVPAAFLLLVTIDCSRSSKPTSLVLVTIDTLRANHLGCYGYFRDTSPNIDRFAEETVFFERCIVPMATTLPSHTSLLTSTYPIEHGVLANVSRGGLLFVPSPGLRSYAEVLRDAGYQTAAFISAAPLKRVTGIAAGFDRFDEPEGAERRAGETNESVFRWLREEAREPYFLWIHYFDPHIPYAPPAPYDVLFHSDAELEAYMDERGFLEALALPGGQTQSFSRFVNAYDGEVRYVDDQFQALLDGLRSRSEWKRTVLVLASDHGEGLGQHGIMGHSYTWDEHLHAALMVRVPGGKARRASGTISLVDLLPTLFGLVPELPRGEFLDQARGRNASAPGFEPLPVFSQDSPPQRHDPAPGNFSLTTEEWKFFHEPEGADHLYYLPDDPFEMNDVSARYPDKVEAFRKEVLRLVAEQNRAAAVYQAGREDTMATVDPEVLEQLRSLGYF